MSARDWIALAALGFAGWLAGMAGGLRPLGAVVMAPLASLALLFAFGIVADAWDALVAAQRRRQGQR